MKEKEKIIGAAHTYIVRKRGKGPEYAPSVHEIQEVIDNFILRTDKKTYKCEFVSSEHAAAKLKGSYSGNVDEMLRQGLLLQNNFAYYQSIKIK